MNTKHRTKNITKNHLVHLVDEPLLGKGFILL